mmetsp:Transcript_44749/g.82995  ORF Transcript_44749/g.82995 Transcript_44749/m.82995 type:complete len:84 (+) Transcript_44749:28-279(+)
MQIFLQKDLGRKTWLQNVGRGYQYDRILPVPYSSTHSIQMVNLIRHHSMEDVLFSMAQSGLPTFGYGMHHVADTLGLQRMNAL